MLLNIDNLKLELNEDISAMEEEIQRLRKLEEAIVNSTHYNLLAGKTQMVGKGKGKSQKERSRLQHTEIISDAIVQRGVIKIYENLMEQYPYLNSEEYRDIFEYNKQIAVYRARIMAKAHDIGHVAFGHAGEGAINAYIKAYCERFQILDQLIEDAKNGKESISEAELASLESQKEAMNEDIKGWLREHAICLPEIYEDRQGHTSSTTSFSYEHNELSALLLYQIAQKENLNFSKQELDRLLLGVLCHSTSRTDLEMIQDDIVAQFVRVADKIEYIYSDWAEVRSLIRVDSDVEDDIARALNKTRGEIIAQTVDDLVKEAYRKGYISEKHTTMRRLGRMRDLYKDIIYLYNGDYSEKVLNRLINLSDDPEGLTEYYSKHMVVEKIYPPQFVKTTLHKVKGLAMLDELLEISDNPAKLDEFYAKHKEIEKVFSRRFVETVLRDTKQNLSPRKKVEIEQFRNEKNTYNLVSTVIDEIDRQFTRGGAKYSEYKDFIDTISRIKSKIDSEILEEKVFFKSVMQGENSERIHLIYQRILEYYHTHPEEIPTVYNGTISPIDIAPSQEFTYQSNPEYAPLQKVLEYVSLMDDNAFIEKYKELVEERIEKGPGYGIEPIKIEEVLDYLKHRVTDSDGNDKLEGAFIDAAKKKIADSLYTDEEKIKIYEEMCQRFYQITLTPAGQKAKDEFYAIRLRELNEDINYWKRIEEKEGPILPQAENELEEKAKIPDRTSHNQGKYSSCTRHKHFKLVPTSEKTSKTRKRTLRNWGRKAGGTNGGKMKITGNPPQEKETKTRLPEGHGE